SRKLRSARTKSRAERRHYPSRPLCTQWEKRIGKAHSVEEPTMLLHIPDVLGREQVTQLRAALDAADWTDGRETVGAQGAQVKRNQQLPDASSLRRQLGEVVLAALAKNPLYHAAALPMR